jgi:hypothetical protein
MTHGVVAETRRPDCVYSFAFARIVLLLEDTVNVT